MGQTIKDLYDGKIAPAHDPWQPTERQQQISDKLDAYVKKIESQLPEAHSMFMQMEPLNNESGSITDLHIFEKGFRLGVRLVAESLVD